MGRVPRRCAHAVRGWRGASGGQPGWTGRVVRARGLAPNQTTDTGDRRLRSLGPCGCQTHMDVPLLRPRAPEVSERSCPTAVEPGTQGLSCAQTQEGRSQGGGGWRERGPPALQLSAFFATLGL